MKHFTLNFERHHKLHRCACRIVKRVQWLMLAIAMSLSGSGAMAVLPTVSNPSRGVTAGNYLKLFQDYLYDFGLVIGLAISAFALFKVASGAIVIYHEVQEGKKKWGDMGMHLGVGVGLLVAIVFLVTQASGVL